MKKRAVAWSLGILAVLLVSGCQDLFTTSPLAFLRRDPAGLPLEQRVTYAEDALASGDADAMADAYAAIKNDAAASTDGELTLLAADLALELSGAPDLVYEVLDGTVDLSDPTTAEEALDTFFATVDGDYVTDAASFFQITLDNDPSELSTQDYLLGAGCLLFEAAVSVGDVSDLDASDVQPASDFVDAGITELAAAGIGEGDPSYDMLKQLQDFLSDTTIFPSP